MVFQLEKQRAEKKPNIDIGYLYVFTVNKLQFPVQKKVSNSIKKEHVLNNLQ